MSSSDVSKAADALRGAERVLVFAGSGFSAESGVPTFRGEDGLFADDDIAELAYARTLLKEPERALTWYEKARKNIAALDPNPGHHALARMSRTADYTVSTQNVDGLLERACQAEGIDLDVHHIHGTLFRVRCNDCERSVDDDVDLSEVPRCDHCDGLLRPDVVLFGEMLPRNAFNHSVTAAEEADVCLLLGTSGLVHPANGLPRKARSVGATLIEVNPAMTELSTICDVVLRGKTGEVLPEIEERMR